VNLHACADRYRFDHSGTGHVRHGYPDEVHTDVWESFIVLEGECECYIGTDTVVRLKAGGYLEIPMHEHHDVKIISDYVVGIMQRIASLVTGLVFQI